MIKKTTFLISVLTWSLATFAQDALFTQTIAGNINLNTALTGSDSNARLALNYRNQWPSLAGNYITTSANFYQYIPKLNGYGGINLLSDNQGQTIFSRTASLFYSQNLNLGNVLIRPSIELGLGNKSADWSKLTFGDMIDPQQGFVYQTGDTPVKNINYIDLNAGFIVAYKKLTLGFSAHHLNSPNVSLTIGNTRLPIHYGTQFSYTHDIEKIKLSVSPFATFNAQNGFYAFKGGINLLFKKHYNLAIATMNKNYFSFNLGYQNKRLSINYSYDQSISCLNNSVSGAAHEIGLAVKFWNVKPVKRIIPVVSVFQ